MPQLCNNCTGCGACTAICPKNAIFLKEDKMGFLSPQISNQCIKCDLCTKMCSIKNETSKPLKVYGVRHRDMKELETSRSGGFFAAIAEYVLINGGTVYGSSMLENFSVCHKRITSCDQIISLKKSKYTHSLIKKELYEQIIIDLKNGKSVLFTGTGCQVGKLKQLLITKRIDLSNLLLMDIICHGVPTQKLWLDYVHYIEKRFNSKIKTAEFRDKSIGWVKPFESFTFKGFYPRQKHFSNIYTKLFYSNNFLRESCFKCEYACLDRSSDFTIGDYWGWENACPEMNRDDRGLSLVLLNSKKALECFSKIENRLLCVDCTEKEYMQNNLRKATDKPLSYEDAQSKYINLGFDGYIDSLGFESHIFRIKENIRSFIFNYKGKK